MQLLDVATAANTSNWIIAVEGSVAVVTFFFLVLSRAGHVVDFYRCIVIDRMRARFIGFPSEQDSFAIQDRSQRVTRPTFSPLYIFFFSHL